MQTTSIPKSTNLFSFLEKTQAYEDINGDLQNITQLSFEHILTSNNKSYLLLFGNGNHIVTVKNDHNLYINKISKFQL